MKAYQQKTKTCALTTPKQISSIMTELICETARITSGLADNDLFHLVEKAKVAAIKGGELLMKNYCDINSIKDKGRKGDLVTNADIEAEEEIINYLKSETPEIGIIAEESGISGEKSDLCWCIDPLDGTTNYAHGYPFFATSIGLIFKNKPLLGSIYIPYLKELFWGCPSIGSFCNDKNIVVSSTSSLIDSLLVTGFAYDRQQVKDNNYAEFCSLTHLTRGVRRGGAAAVDLAFVASGRLDGYWERGLSKWDLAAGVPLVELAGGLVSDYKSKSFDLDNGRILASTPGIKKELLSKLKKIKPLNIELHVAN